MGPAPSCGAILIFDLLINLAFSKLNQVSAGEPRRSHKRLKSSKISLLSGLTHPPPPSSLNVPTNSFTASSRSSSTGLCKCPLPPPILVSSHSSPTPSWVFSQRPFFLAAGGPVFGFVFVLKPVTNPRRKPISQSQTKATPTVMTAHSDPKICSVHRFSAGSGVARESVSNRC